MSLQNVQNDLLLLLLHPFNGTRKDLNGSRDDGDGSGISWTICKQSAPRSRQITTPTPHHSIFAGWMFFLMPTNSVKRVQNNLSIKILYDIDKGPATAYSILFRTSTSGIKKLQRAQNTLAWIVLPNLQSIPVASLLLRLHWLLVISHIRYKLAAITYKSLSLAQPTCICYFSSINSLDPFGQVARTCWHCLHRQFVIPSLADMLSATAHRLSGTSYHYPSDLSTVSTHSNLI